MLFRTCKSGFGCRPNDISSDVVVMDGVGCKSSLPSSMSGRSGINSCMLLFDEKDRPSTCDNWSDGPHMVLNTSGQGTSAIF